jgi:hypothetical protein
MTMAASTKKSAKPSPSKSSSKLKAKPATPRRSKHFTKAEDEDDEDFEGSEYASDRDPKAKQYDSDALDDDSDDEEKTSPKKRKRASSKKSPKTRSPRKKSKTADDSEEFVEVEDGQEIVGVVVQAPKTGRGDFLVWTVSCRTHCLCSAAGTGVSEYL